jgi:hypothetical protein
MVQETRLSLQNLEEEVRLTAPDVENAPPG